MTKTAYPDDKEKKKRIPSLQELNPTTLALAKETHQQENSITLMPKTGKAGIFEVERSDSSQVNRSTTQYKSLYELPKR